MTKIAWKKSLIVHKAALKYYAQEIILNKIRTSKAYEEFVKTRGENEIIKSFSVEDLLSFN